MSSTLELNIQGSKKHDMSGVYMNIYLNDDFLFSLFIYVLSVREVRLHTFGTVIF